MGTWFFDWEKDNTTAACLSKVTTPLSFITPQPPINPYMHINKVNPGPSRPSFQFMLLLLSCRLRSWGLMSLRILRMLLYVYARACGGEKGEEGRAATRLPPPRFVPPPK